MKNHRWIEISRRVYARLLNLYPKEHRSEYGADMLQVFTDQCRSASQAGNGLGFIALWMRTLIDLGINVLREQFTSPHVWQGLLEAAPNAPLPWKGVTLVLIPGLIFFISQVAQLTGKDWFFLMVLRAAYFMIIPVIIVGVWKRKFPIWGLIPLGLLFYTLLSVGSRLEYFRQRFLALSTSNPLLRWLVMLANVFTPSTVRITIVTVFLLCILALLWSAKRRGGIPAGAWIWLGVYVLLEVFHFLAIRQVSGVNNGVYSTWLIMTSIPMADSWC